MYRLMNFLFGWDYIAWKNSADSGVARVFNDASGRTFYWRYRNTSVLDQIKTAEQVAWLTCSPSKYLGVHEQKAGE